MTGEQTAELAIDDWAWTWVRSRRTPRSGPWPTAPKRRPCWPRVDPNLRQKLARADTERAESNGTTQVRAAPTAQMRATGTWMFTDTDFAKMAPVKGPAAADATQQAKTALITKIEQPAVDTSSTSRLATLDSADLDLDLSSLGNLNDHSGGDVGPGRRRRGRRLARRDQRQGTR